MSEVLTKTAFKQYDPVCWECGRTITHVKDVGDARVILPTNRKQVRCVDCTMGRRTPETRV